MLVEHGFRLPSALDNRPLSHDEFWQRVPQAVFVSATPGRWELEQSELDQAHVQEQQLLREQQRQQQRQQQQQQQPPQLQPSAPEPASGASEQGVVGRASGVTELVLRPTGILDPTVEVRPRGSQLDDLIGEASTRARRGERTLATVLTRDGAERLAETLREHGLHADYMHSGTKPLERVRVLKRLRCAPSRTFAHLLSPSLHFSRAQEAAVRGRRSDALHPPPSLTLSRLPSRRPLAVLSPTPEYLSPSPSFLSPSSHLPLAVSRPPRRCGEIDVLVGVNLLREGLDLPEVSAAAPPFNSSVPAHSSIHPLPPSPDRLLRKGRVRTSARR